jgi:hypothetical protein
MLPEYGQARKAIWDAVHPDTGIRRIDQAFPLEVRESTRDQEMQIILKGGATWQVVGSDSYNRLVGTSPAGVVYSEWALANPAARAYLRPILAENNGWQLFITTPRGRNHAHATFTAASKEPGAFAQRLSAMDTGVFNQARLEAERLAYIADFGDEYGHAMFEQEYLCSWDAAILGGILTRQLSTADLEGRIGSHVTYDPLGAPIEISSDIGHRDSSTWWFWQPCLGGYRVVDYMGGWGQDAEEWADKLKLRLGQYINESGKPALGRIWLPHDARAKTFAAKRSAVETFIGVFGADHISITPNSGRADRVNAARVLTKRVEFSDKCEQGLDGLRAWQYEYDEVSKTFSKEPLHNWASHDGDGYSYGCLIMQLADPPKPRDEPMRGIFVGQTAVSLEELWKSAPKRSERL